MELFFWVETCSKSNKLQAYHITSLTPEANRMSPWTRFSYVMTNQFVKAGGIDVLECSEQDFSHLISQPGVYREVQNLAPFSGARQAILPEECPTKKELKDF